MAPNTGTALAPGTGTRHWHLLAVRCVISGMGAGGELRVARERRGWTRDELSARTKISMPMLEAIEECQFNRLPPAIYLRGFLRVYAAEVGLPPATTVERYLAYCESAQLALTAFHSEAPALATVVSARAIAITAADEFQSETPMDQAPASTASVVSVAPEPSGAASVDAPLLPPSAAPGSPMPSHSATRRAFGRVAALAASVALMVTSVVLMQSLGSATQPVTLAAMPSAASESVTPEPIAAQPLTPPIALRASIASEPAAVRRVPPSGYTPASSTKNEDGEPGALSGSWSD